jgi:hypothetical protein
MISNCLSEMQKAVGFFQEKLNDPKLESLSILEGFLDFLSCQPIIHYNIDLFTVLVNKNNTMMQTKTKSVTTQSICFQPQDFMQNPNAVDGVSSPRGSIGSYDGEEEKKESDSVKEIKFNFQAELNNEMVFDHKRMMSTHIDFLNDSCKVHLTSSFKTVAIEDLGKSNTIYLYDLIKKEVILKL